MRDLPGQQQSHGVLGTAISTATSGNATAFGVSITITGSFGMLQALVGTPTVVQILMFGVAAAATIGTIEALMTSGFRERPGAAPAEVRMLATAQGLISVAAGPLLDGTGAWPLGAAAASLVLLAAESVDTFLAEAIQKRRGDPEAEQGQQDPSKGSRTGAVTATAARGLDGVVPGR